MANINTPKLLENETLQCEGKLTLKECWDALVSMGSNKSPGNDGLTKEFYVCFFAEVGSLLVSTLNFCHDKGELTSQKQAVITLIEKRRKDKRFIKNWRPISLLNVDVKIASKALAVRLKKVINKLIAYEQTAYVQGRYIGESIRVIQDLIEFADLEDQEGLTLSSDLEKAFDSVDFLFSVLRKFGFGPSFIQWVKTLLCKLESCVMNNGCSTGYFTLHRGTRQGDSLSPYLFILVLEILFIQVRSNTDILGFTIEDISLKLSAYVDDAYYFLKDIVSLQVLYQLFSNFEEFSSLKVNLDKCEACWIGASKFNTDTPLGCSWLSLTNGSIRVLGNFISYNDLIAHQLNFLNIIPTVKDLLGIWKQRNLTIAGKIQVFKLLIFSKLVYVATMNTVPKTITDQLQVIHKDFIWSGKKVTIKHSTLIGEYADGGLLDLDISSSLTSVKISWIRRLFDNNYHPWTTLAKRLLSKVGGLYIFHFDLKLSEQSLYDVKHLPSFYKDLVLLWEKYSNSKER